MISQPQLSVGWLHDLPAFEAVRKQAFSSSYLVQLIWYARPLYFREISETLGITEGASKSQLSRARAILKEKILKIEGSNYATHAG